ncbi:unnamed protein product [Rotaria sordida]|uniref:Uncharacterized protein n=2 Tax=Rotaria sordida TaxID=392033 RepID=A0A816F239_9BILA|nr:unnamed protein product [Rotaria sordida]CAF1654989.1 unnamed protein product [Rotaria sordida]CAF4213157.1 unnamed protein product [Rotaria sordida]
MRFFFIVVCIIAVILRLTTGLPHDRMRRGPVDLSGLTGNGGMSFICVFPPCPVQPLVLPSMVDWDWDAIHASIAQWNKEQEELLLSKIDD